MMMRALVPAYTPEEQKTIIQTWEDNFAKKNPDQVTHRDVYRLALQELGCLNLAAKTPQDDPPDKQLRQQIKQARVEIYKRYTHLNPHQAQRIY